MIDRQQKLTKALHIKRVRLDAPIARREDKVKFISKQKQVNKKRKTVKCCKFSELFSVKTSILIRIFYVIKHNNLLCYLEEPINKGL